jgi:hypothetical protein
MTDFLGPANAANAVTSRPTDTRSFGSLDSWFKDCSSPSAADGTEIQAGWLNAITGALRSLWRANGMRLDGTTPVVTEDGTDDGGLAKSMQQMVQRGQVIYGVDSSTTLGQVTVSLSPALIEYKAGQAFTVKFANDCGGATNININALGNKSLTRVDGSALQVKDFSAGMLGSVRYDGTRFQLLNLSQSLASNLDFYVNASTGSDSIYDGTAASVSGTHGPWQSLQHAADVVSKLNLNGHAITVHVADGTYAPFALTLVNIAGSLSFIGNTTTPANCLITSSALGGCISGYGNGAIFTVRGFKVVNSNQFGISATAGAQIFYADIDFGACTYSHIFMDFGSCSAVGNYTISGSSTYHAQVQGNVGYFIPTPSFPNTITLVGTPNFSGAFVSCISSAVVRASSGLTTFSGTATGARYSVTSNALIQTNGSGASFFPGNAAGSFATQGQYL